MGTTSVRPHVRLPADVPHRRRRGGDRRAAGQRRLGGDPREILGARVLGRRRALRLHDVPVYRRAVPLSAERAAACEARRATACGSPAATACAPTSGGVPSALPHPAHHRVLCGDRRQRDAVQFRRQAGRDRPPAAPARAAVSGAHRPVRRRTRSGRCATRAASASPARRAKSARRSGRSSTTARRCRPIASRAMRTRRTGERRSCATCSSRATPGSAPAT